MCMIDPYRFDSVFVGTLYSYILYEGLVVTTYIFIFLIMPEKVNALSNATHIYIPNTYDK